MSVTPFQFLPPPSFPTLSVQPLPSPSTADTNAAHHVPLYSPQDQEKLYNALQMRIHSPDLLKSRNYVVPLATQHGVSIDRNQHKGLPPSVKIKDVAPTKPPLPGKSCRRAIALDCEMVRVLLWNEKDASVNITDSQPSRNKAPCKTSSELAQLCLVDLLTGEILIDRLVNPSGRKIIDYRTKWSGITASRLRIALENGQALRGWKAARKLLLEYVDADTIMVGHSLMHDLHMLRLGHARCIDNCLLASEAVFGRREDHTLPRMYSLKDLMHDLVGKEIQSSKKGHDCVEDTLAARELCLWTICNREALRTWAQTKRIQHEERMKQRAMQREAQEKEKEEKAGVKSL